MKSNTKNIYGFTLVELLVVISIIALLLSIMMPSLQRARESAKRVQCLSNLNGAGMIWLMYANDNNGKIVPSNGTTNGSAWFDRLSVHLTKKAITQTKYPKLPDRNTFTCPSVKALYQDNWGNIYAFNYAMNVYCGIYWSNRSFENVPTRLMDIKNSAQKVILSDGFTVEFTSPGTRMLTTTIGFWSNPSEYYNTVNQVNYYVGMPHEGGKSASFLWADGHSSSEKRTKWDTRNTKDNTGAGWWVLKGQ